MSSRPNNDIMLKAFVLGFLRTNCYVLWDAAAGKGVIIDPAVYDKSIEDLLGENGIKDVVVVNTHGHADHIGGDAGFGFPVYIHGADADDLKEVTGVEPARLLREGDVIGAGKIRFRVIHTPGHTPGGISLVFGNMLFSGDTLFFEGVGRTDRPEGDTASLKMSIEQKLFSLPGDTRVFPGHGPETTIGHEKSSGYFL